MKYILVTGGNRGLGLEIVKGLAAPDTHIIVACRDVMQGKEAIRSLKGSFDVVALDLCSLSSIDSLVNDLNNRYPCIDILVNNAGIFENSGAKISAMNHVFSKVWMTNTFGPHQLTKKLAPLLDKATKPKCIFMCSVAGHHKHLDISTIDGQLPKLVYGQSKYADLLLTALFAEEHPTWQVLAAHPGYSNTEIFDGRIAGKTKQWIRLATNLIAQSPEKGAQSAILAIRETFASGSYLGPKYLKELYVPPRLRKIKDYFFPEDLETSRLYLNSLSYN